MAAPFGPVIVTSEAVKVAASIASLNVSRTELTGLVPVAFGVIVVT